MFIKSIYIKNFKSIKEANIQFSPMSMIVGANASGKSNLINVFRFIKDIATDGVENAVALQGGIPYLANMSLKKGTPIEINFVLDLSMEGWIRNTMNKNLTLGAKEIEYRFVLQPHLKGTGYRIAEDYLKMTFSCYKHDSTAAREEKDIELGYDCSFVFHKKNINAKIQKSTVFSKENIDDEYKLTIEDDRTASFFEEWTNDDRKELMLYRIPVLLPSDFSEHTFIRIFDFDPKELKKSSSMASVRILEENGSNMASVLQVILRSKEKRKKLTTLLKQYLPFVDGVFIENNLDRSFSYKLKESYSNKSFHANFLSDGTVSILAIIIALYFEERSNIVILEEPERNIHPKLLSNILQSAEDVSREKQVIITTHNPEFLRHVQIKDIRFASRDQEGFTILRNPESSEMVKCFIENDLGLDDLFLQNLLGE